MANADELIAHAEKMADALAKEDPPYGVVNTIHDLAAALRAADRRIAELVGAADADENRLRQAAECAGVGYFGCDTPEVLADTIGELRQRIAELERDRERLDWLDSGEITLTLYDRDKTEKRSAREVIDAARAGEREGE